MSECPMKEHRIVLSCKDQYMMRSAKDLMLDRSDLLTVIVSFASCQNALVMVSEFDKINTIPFAVVSVDSLASFKVVETHRKVFAAGHEVLSVVTYVHRIDLLLEILENQSWLERLNDVV